MTRSRLALVTGLALAALLPAAPARALDPARAMTQYVQSRWRVEEGLPHNSVRAIHQTRDGYLWLGTYGGLARFDGVRFKVFDRSNSALTNNEVRTLAEDASGILWVGTSAGGLYQYQNGELKKGGATIGSETINALLVAHDGSLLVATSEGLYQVKGAQTSQFTTREGLLSNSVTALAEGPDGRVYIGSEIGINILEKGRIVPGPAPSRTDRSIWTLLVDRKGNLYAGGANLDRFDPAGRRTLTRTTTGFAVFSLLEDADGQIWVGLYGEGIGRLEGDTLRTWSEEKGFLDRRAWALATDREGGLWIGTRAGLAQFRDGAAVSYAAAEGYAGTVARAILEDRDGSLWFAYQGGVSHVDRGRVRNYTVADGLPHPTARGLWRDRRGRLWVATDGGLAEETSPGRFRVHGPSAGVTSAAKSLLEDRSGRLWVALDRGVLLVEGGRPTAPPALRPLAESSIEAIYEDRDGALWIGTLANGAWRYKDGVLAQVPLLGLTSIGVRSFFEDHDGVFYVGTIGSGLLLRAPGRDFRQLTSAEGLGDDSIWSLLDDEKGNVWMTSDRGVFRVAMAELSAYAAGRAEAIRINARVGASQGLRSSECNGGSSPAGLITRDGLVAVPTGSGVGLIDPRRLTAEGPPPPVRIEEVVADRVALPEGESARVPPGTRDTEIHFTGLSFKTPPEIRFRYRLEGHDRDWIDGGTRRVAYYGGLRPGTYRFRVAASSDGRNWSAREETLVLVVAPLWYQSWLFTIAATGAGAALLGLALAWRVRGLRRRAVELEELVAARTVELAERTSELEIANAALGRLAITDDLSGIANHRRFREFLEREWARCMRTREPISLLMCDIDDFKAYNDALGHQAGDECLRAVARSLSQSVRRISDLAARYGGEEFAVVLPATGAEGAAAVAASIRAALRERAIPHPRSSTGGSVTMSIGAATLVPPSGSAPETLIAAADTALYAAKGAGRDRCVVAAT